MIEYTDFPNIPNDVVQKVLELAKNYIDNFDYNSDPYNHKDKWLKAVTDSTTRFGLPAKDGLMHYPNCGIFSLIDAPECLKSWAYENLEVVRNPNVYTHVGIQIMHGGDKIFPHVDEDRTNAYNYILTDDHAVTSFYKPNNEFNQSDVKPYIVFLKSQLTKISELEIETRRWHNFPTSIIHTVENIHKNRIAVTISVVDHTVKL
jgi:hypothetical protein